MTEKTLTRTTCASCFRFKEEGESEEGWLFWEMSGAVKNAPSGAWLCPRCVPEQEKRRKKSSKK